MSFWNRSNARAIPCASWPISKARRGASSSASKRDYKAIAPKSIASLLGLLDVLRERDVDLDRVELDLGFGRGIGFYSQMIFELIVPTSSGPVEVCGGGRYDGLARVLGSDRDPRGVGFAIGLERLAAVLPPDSTLPNFKRGGYLILAGNSGAARMRSLWHIVSGSAVRKRSSSRRRSTIRSPARAIGLRYVATVLGPIEAKGSIRVRDIDAKSAREIEVPFHILTADRDTILGEDPS